MAGIYIHVPFCKQACHYCDFHFSTSLKTKDPVIQSILREMELRKDFLSGETVETLYFGGGTPSVLSASELSSIAEKARNTFSLGTEIEFTVEANPDDLSLEKLQELADAGVNRLSIGIQSFSDKYLKWMNRAHNAREAVQAIENAQKVAITNLSIDLIYGLPNLTLDDWISDIEKAIELGVQHISAYCLTVESDTALGHWVKKGKEKPIDEAAAEEQFRILIDTLSENGFEQYEVSNFSLPGFYSKHNTAYWLGVPYLGIGPSAHSFKELERSWNIANNVKYTKEIKAGELPLTIEKLSKIDRHNEYVMTGLRTKWGIDLEKIKMLFGISVVKNHGNYLEKLTEEGKATLKENRLVLTKKGMFLADGIASELFVTK